MIYFDNSLLLPITNTSIAFIDLSNIKLYFLHSVRIVYLLEHNDLFSYSSLFPDWKDSNSLSEEVIF